MLVPLDAMPGWPDAADPSALQVLGLLVGFPVLGFIVIALLAKASGLAKASKGSMVTVVEPLWLGATAEQSNALSTGEEDSAEEDSANEDRERGGASVVW